MLCAVAAALIQYHYLFILHFTIWGVKPVVTHQTSWLESTGLCGVRQNQAGGSSVCHAV